MLVWWHKGEPNSQPLTHYILALKMHVLIHCILRLKLLRKISIPNSCWTAQPVQWTGPLRCSFTHTDCISHLNQGHFPDESHSVTKAGPGIPLNPEEGSVSDSPVQGSHDCEQHSLGPTFSFPPPLPSLSSLVCSASIARFPQQCFLSC